jgi:hypothetical protein
VTGGAREICHHVLHVHDPDLVLLQVCRYRARGLGSLSVFCLVLAQHLLLQHATYGGDLESRRGGPLLKSLPRPLQSLPRDRPPPPPPRPRSGRSERSLWRKESIMAFCACSSARRASAAALESYASRQRVVINMRPPRSLPAPAATRPSSPLAAPEARPWDYLGRSTSGPITLCRKAPCPCSETL